MKVNVGIVGYGNLGKAVEQLAINDRNINLVAIFSRRRVVSSFGTTIVNVNCISDYKDKIDVMIMCGGSMNDIHKQAETLIKEFNVINSFDTHEKIAAEIKFANFIAKRNKKVALYSFGWDPGLFSLMRLLFSNISNSNVQCSYGKGVSMGHSNALLQIKGVKYARAYTIPVLHGKKIKNDKKIEHKRICYIVKNKNANSNLIIENIKENKEYFNCKKLKIKFINEKTYFKKHSKLYHAGKVVTNFNIKNEKFSMEFKVDMTSNAIFTAKIMLVYAKAIKRIKNRLGCGAFTILDIPPSLISNKNKNDTTKQFC